MKPPLFLVLLLLAGALPSAPAGELAVVAESPVFTLNTRLSTDGQPTVLVATGMSPAFALDTRLAGPIESLLVRASSPSFEVNTMWLGLRRAARAAGSPVELYWPTNAPGFFPQSALPPLQPSMPWMDMTNSISESGGLYRIQFPPEGTERCFRLKL